jgi:hypothetical protein
MEAARTLVSENELTFPVVLQRYWDISRQYGRMATPIAYLVDEQGMVVGEAAWGKQEILALATRCAAKMGSHVP